MKYPILLLLAVLVIGCDDAIVMGYDETQNEPILENSLNLSPKENVRQFLSENGVEAQSVAIYSSPAKDCACAKSGGDCYCRLDNLTGYGPMCADAETLCKKAKYIEVEVAATASSVLEPLGFEQVE